MNNVLPHADDVAKTMDSGSDHIIGDLARSISDAAVKGKGSIYWSVDDTVTKTTEGIVVGELHKAGYALNSIIPAIKQYRIAYKITWAEE